MIEQCELQAPGDSLGHGPLDTVYFGGGTPSLLSPAQLARVLDAVRSTYGIALGAEVTIEMDPGTFDLDKALAFRALGATRWKLLGHGAAHTSNTKP